MGGVVAIATLALVGGGIVLRGSGGFANDFYDYWGAARLLAAGHSPYDTLALVKMQHRAGIQATAGDGYSYPLLLAILLLPLAALPPLPGAVAFLFFNAVMVGLASVLLATLAGSTSRGAVAAAAAATLLFAPLLESCFFGHVNPLVVVLVAAAAGGGSAAWLALASAFKLFPAAGLAAWIPGRMPAALAGTGMTILLVGLPRLLPFSAGAGGRLAGMLGPDPYWSNQSLNGFLSRLALATPWTLPPFPGLPVVPINIAVVGLTVSLLAIAVARHGGRRPALAMTTAVALAAVLAPKDSLWNLAMLLPAMALAWRLGRPRVRVLIALGYGLLELQGGLNLGRDSIYGHGPLGSLASSAGFYGAVLVTIGAAVALTANPRPQPGSPADDVEGAEIDGAAIAHPQDKPPELGLERHPGRVGAP
ncbi:MAG: glycosyltransferase 87 family protein [Candidatus Dormibacteria bacterium]